MLFHVLGSKSSFGCPATVTLPFFVGWMYWRWLPFWSLRYQPSARRRLIASRTFTLYSSSVTLSRPYTAGLPVSHSSRSGLLRRVLDGLWLGIGNRLKCGLGGGGIGGGGRAVTVARGPIDVGDDEQWRARLG